MYVYCALRAGFYFNPMQFWQIYISENFYQTVYITQCIKINKYDAL